MYCKTTIPAVLIGFVLTITVSYGQTDHNYLFKTITFREGLSHSRITDIAQDSQGYIWVGTENGLNRFDGTEVVVFKHILNDSTSLSNNSIRKIFFDSQQRMWLVTASGVCQYQPTTNDFKTFPFDAVADRTLPLDIVESPEGQILVLSHHNTVSVFSEEQNRFEKYLTIDFDPVVRALSVYRGRLFAGAQQFLLEIHPRTGQVIDSYELYDESRPLSSGITQIKVVDEQLWIAGMMMHLYRFDPMSQTVDKINDLPYTTSVAPLTDQTLLVGSYEGGFLYRTTTGQVSPLSSVDNSFYLSNVAEVFVDKDRNLWMASQQQGVIYTIGQHVFRDIRHLNEDLVPYANNISSLQIIDGHLWIGLNTGRIIVVDPKDNQYRKFYQEPISKLLPGHGTVFTILEDSRARVWVGSYQGGLRWYDSSSDSFVESNAIADSLRIRSSDVRDIVEDPRGQLWLAVHGQGIDVYDPVRKEVTASYGLSAGDADPYISDWTSQLVIAPDSAVWIASSSGVQVIDEATKKYFQHHPEQPGSLSNDNVNCLLLDTRGYLWIGTAEGLNVLNTTDSSFTKFTTRQGLNDNYISSVIEDPEGNLWIGTYDGLSRLSYTTTPQEATIRDIELPPGLYSNQFVERASTIDSAGNLYFATTHGILTFNPEDLPRTNTASIPEVLLTNFEVINQSPGEDKKKTLPAARSLIGLAADTLSRIRLAPDENTVSLSFAAIDFAHSDQIRYHYRLQGYHDRWSASTERSVTYHRLPPGEYQFQVRATLANTARTSPSRSLTITIESPWYDTPAGKVAMVLMLAAVVALGVYVWLERIRLKNQAQLAEKEREIDQLKIKFFMNVSHEFRTPLTLILGPLEKLLHSINNHDSRRYLLLIQRNTQRLSRLVGQLLDLRQLEKQRYQLRVTQGDLVDFVRDTYQSFHCLAERQAIDYRFEDETHGLASSWFDADAIDKILCNLLSNAFKYTPNHGCITVLVSNHATRNDWIAVRVSDTGVGISEDQLHKIFQRFYRTDATAQVSGTGIGLSLCQELVHLHQGEITVTSALNQGSTFTVAIPTHAEAYSPSANSSIKEVTTDYTYPKNAPHPFVENQVVEDAFLLARRDDSSDSRPLVLIVDDNVDLLHFIRESISSDFIIVTAQNGQEAFQKAVTIVPDAIVSDVAMPVMDGFHLVQQLKEDMHTSHVPVVLLTARTSEQYQVEGLRRGGDDYITKPFSVEILTAKLHSLIANRAKLRNLLTGTDWPGLQQQVGESVEHVFLLKLTTLIDKNIEETSFGTDDICQSMGMSRSQLYRKLSAVTGQSVHEFIKLHRLAKAAELLSTSDHTVTETANLTGFKHVQTFTRSFKEHYACTPGQYAKRQVQNV